MCQINIAHKSVLLPICANVVNFDRHAFLVPVLYAQPANAKSKAFQDKFPWLVEKEGR